MRAAAHPVGIGAEIQVRGPGAKFSQKLALGLRFGCGVRRVYGIVSTRRILPAHELNAYVGGLDSGAVGQKEITKRNRVADAERCLAIFVVLLDAAF